MGHILQGSDDINVNFYSFFCLDYILKSFKLKRCNNFWWLKVQTSKFKSFLFMIEHIILCTIKDETQNAFTIKYYVVFAIKYYFYDEHEQQPEFLSWSNTNTLSFTTNVWCSIALIFSGIWTTIFTLKANVLPFDNVIIS